MMPRGRLFDPVFGRVPLPFELVVSASGVVVTLAADVVTVAEGVVVGWLGVGVVVGWSGVGVVVGWSGVGVVVGDWVGWGLSSGTQDVRLAAIQG
jgi:hypothetical protein